MLVDKGEILGVEALNFSLQGFQAAFVIEILHLFPDFGLNLRHGIDTVAYCINKEARATRHDDAVVGLEKFIQQLQSITLIVGDIIFVLDADMMHEVMFDLA